MLIRAQFKLHALTTAAFWLSIMAKTLLMKLEGEKQKEGRIGREGGEAKGKGGRKGGREEGKEEHVNGRISQKRHEQY